MGKGPVETVQDISTDSLSSSHESRALVRKQDLRIVPLCASIYLLCYLDRSNIGNAKVLNAGTHNDVRLDWNLTPVALRPNRFDLTRPTLRNSSSARLA